MHKDSLMEISFKPWPNGFASRRKFAKPEVAHGLALDGQTVKNLRRLAYEFSSTKVNAGVWPNETQVERKSKTCVDFGIKVDLRVRLARTLHNF